MTMKNTRKISEHADKNKKKISKLAKGGRNPKINKDEVCVSSDVVFEEQEYCCRDVCC